MRVLRLIDGGTRSLEFRLELTCVKTVCDVYSGKGSRVLGLACIRFKESLRLEGSSVPVLVKCLPQARKELKRVPLKMAIAYFDPASIDFGFTCWAP